MFYVSENMVREQDGKAEYFVLPADIEYLANNADARNKLLQALQERSILVSTVTKSKDRTLDLADFLDAGSGIHSKL